MTATLKRKFNSALTEIRKFIESDCFIYCVGAFVFLFSCLGLDFAGFGLCVVIISATFAFHLKPRTCVPAIITVVFSMSRQNSPVGDGSYAIQNMDMWFSKGAIAFYVIIGVMLVASLTYGFLTDKKKVLKTGALWGLLAMSSVFAIGGLFTRYYHVGNILLAIVLMFTFVCVYCLFSAYLTKDDFSYCAKAVITMSVVAALELFNFYITTPEMFKTYDKGMIVLGWGSSNNISTVIAFGVPFAVWFMAKSKFPGLFLLLAAGLVFAIVFTFSRSGLLISVPTAFIGTVYCMIKRKGYDRVQVIVTVAVLLCLIAALFFAHKEKILDALSFYIKVGISDRGRLPYVKRGLDAFAKFPFLGVGFMEAKGLVAESLPFYHNTIIQYLANCGIVGICAYAFHIITLARIFLRSPALNRTVLGVALLMINVQSMLDWEIFLPYVTFVYVMCIALGEKLYAEQVGKAPMLARIK